MDIARNRFNLRTKDIHSKTLKLMIQKRTKTQNFSEGTPVFYCA